MKNLSAAKQQGAVLIVALVMLLALTMLSISNMRGVTLEARLTANRAESQRLFDAADAALREGELRLYSSYGDDLTDYKVGNCIKTNTLSESGINKPCLLNDAEIDLDEYFESPIKVIKSLVSSDVGLKWMPYRGLDAKKPFETNQSNPKSYWNIYRLRDVQNTENPEYSLEGDGVSYFLVTGQANDKVAVQSTVKIFSLGKN